MLKALQIGYRKQAVIGLAFSLSVLSILIYSLSAQAQLPDAPVLLDFGAGGCVPNAEICGDGLDQDCDGGDLACTRAMADPEAGTSSQDADADGYRADADCDDNNRKIYPGIYAACSAGDGEAGTRLCQENGSYGSCTTTPLCEASGSGRCYYVSKLTGDDANPGTFAAPLKTLRRLNSYNCPPGGASGCQGDWQPTNVIRLQPGDAVYLMSGVYDEVVQYGVWKNVLYVNRVAGTPANPLRIKAYPGAHPILSPATRAKGIQVQNSSHVLIEGIEINRAYGIGLWLTDGSDYEARNMWIHHTDGVDNDNVSGLTPTDVNGLYFHHNLLHDNFDKTAADTGGKRTENSRNIVAFKGGNHRYSYNVLFQTPPVSANLTGGCFAYKHEMSVPNAVLEFDHNVLRNCFFSAIGTGTFNGHFHHNAVYDSSIGLSVRNHGHSTVNLINNVAEFNTFIRTRALDYDIPAWEGNPNINFGNLTFQNNLVVDNNVYNTDEGGITRVDVYGNNETYTKYMAENYLRFSDNCYFNDSNPVRFCLTCGYGSRSLGILGDLTAIQALGIETGSHVINPQIDSQLAPSTPVCENTGIYAQ